MNNYTVLVLEKMLSLTSRMKNILSRSNVSLIAADNEVKLHNNIQKAGQEISLVILDIELSDSNALELIAKVRQKVSTAPIIVLTDVGSKSDFVDALLQGATDFIIKPFGDQTFYSKVIRYLIPENIKNTELVTLDLNRIIKGELRKAEKGQFPVSILFLAMGSDASEPNDADTASLIFENMSNLFWDTDMFVKFMSKYYFGIFPFCDEKNTAIIKDKMEVKFDELKQSTKVPGDYKMTSVFVSYPFDTQDSAEVYNMLRNRIKGYFKNIAV